MRLPVFAAAFSVAALTLVTGRVVLAQSVTLVSSYPQRTNTSKVPASTDTTAGNAGISRADCDSDEEWKFAFQIAAGTSFQRLEIWARAADGNCSFQEARAPGNAKVCFRVAGFAFSKVSAQQIVTIKADQMIDALYGKVDVTDGLKIDRKALCYNAASMPATNIYLNFVLFDGSGNPLDAPADSSARGANESNWLTRYDLAGPAPPTDVKLSAGETLLKLNWSNPSAFEEGFQAYRAYCFPNYASTAAALGIGAPASGARDLDGGTTDGATDATATDATTDVTTDAASDSVTTDSGVVDTGVADTAVVNPTPTGTCPSGVPFVPGILPSADIEKYECASTGNTSTSMVISGLTNNKPYAVAIASIDRFGNSGPLSTYDCLTPKETTDFYDSYRAAGGTAGGGFCGVGSSNAPGNTIILSLLALVGVGLIARRRSP